MSSFDHVLIATQDLTRWRATMEQAGFTVTDRDQGMGLALPHLFVLFEDGSYLEALDFGVDHPVAASHRLSGKAVAGETLADYSLTVPSVDEAVARVEAAGLPTAPAKDESRPVPGGGAWSLRIAMLGIGNGRAETPFVVEDVANRQLRSPYTSSGMHRNGARRMLGVTVVTDDLEAATAALSAIVESEPLVTTYDVYEGARGARYSVGEQWLLVVAANEDTPVLAKHLAQHGAGVYEVTVGPQAAGPGDGELVASLEGLGLRVRLVPTTPLEAFLRQPRVGVLAVQKADGKGIQQVPVWYQWDSERFTVLTDASSAKVTNVRRAERVSFCVADPDSLTFVVAEGRPVLAGTPTAEERARLWHFYRGDGARADSLASAKHEGMVRLQIEPSHWVTRLPS